MTAVPLDLAQIATEQYLSRQAKAQQIVRNGGMSAAQATHHLRPWLAIACTLGASLPEIDAVIADLDELNTASKHTMSPGTLRAMAAEEICPRRIWAPILQRARDLAFDRFLELDNAGTLLAATTMSAMARALQHDINGHHVHPYTAAPRDTPPAIPAQAIAA